MNDFFVDSNLVKELRQLNSNSNNNKEPLPEKLKKQPIYISSSTFNSSGNNKQMVSRKEILDLENKFKALEKNYTKLLNKYNDVTTENKTLKTTNDELLKELNVLSLTKDKLYSEKVNNDKIIEENKSYIRKIESRLVNGAKNQYLVEINNKLRKEIEDCRRILDESCLAIQEEKDLNKRKTEEIKILNKALVRI